MKVFFGGRPESRSFRGRLKGCEAVVRGRRITESPGRGVFALAVSLLLAGCGLLPVLDDSSPYYKVPKGSVIELNERIEIPRSYARVWIQNGVVAGTRFDAFEPACGVEVSAIDRKTSQYVEPGRFRVVRVQFLREEIVSAQPLRVALAGVNVPSGGDYEGPPSDPLYHEGYHLWVENPDQPNVRRFTCRGVYDLPANARPPSIREIQAVLQPVATLLMPDELEAEK